MKFSSLIFTLLGAAVTFALAPAAHSGLSCPSYIVCKEVNGKFVAVPSSCNHHVSLDDTIDTCNEKGERVYRPEYLAYLDFSFTYFPTILANSSPTKITAYNTQELGLHWKSHAAADDGQTQKWIDQARPHIELNYYDRRDGDAHFLLNESGKGRCGITEKSESCLIFQDGTIIRCHTLTCRQKHRELMQETQGLVVAPSKDTPAASTRSPSQAKQAPTVPSEARTPSPYQLAEQFTRCRKNHPRDIAARVACLRERQ